MPLGTGRKQACKEMTKLIPWKEKKEWKPKSSFWRLLRRPKLYTHLRKEELNKIKESLGKLSCSEVVTGLLNRKSILTAGKHNLGGPLSGRLELKFIRSFPLAKRRFFADIAQVSITCFSPFLHFLSKMRDNCIKPQSISNTVSRTSHTSCCCPIPCQASPVQLSSYQRGLRFLVLLWYQDLCRPTLKTIHWNKTQLPEKCPMLHWLISPGRSAEH